MTLPEHRLRKLTEWEPPWGDRKWSLFSEKGKMLCAQEIKLVLGDGSQPPPHLCGCEDGSTVYHPPHLGSVAGK